ncbi:Beta-lactamase class A [Parafrankia irregularis]|uniref:Beta-lactamase class A n=1 Tax=Parafrankia irregularis TaxID=795642 RepID=A0A0S4QIJ6_9ACTN|nr:serine hydrolase [Parafrankia irregularis]MBE3203802.1 serine hydrolase [Parafrankia sp. CH37]CUU55329.1 Beta-lactamase class A [Parafrankia irregularis]
MLLASSAAATAAATVTGTAGLTAVASTSALVHSVDPSPTTAAASADTTAAPTSTPTATTAAPTATPATTVEPTARATATDAGPAGSNAVGAAEAPNPLAASSASAQGGVTASVLAEQFRAYLAGRPGSTSVALYDAATGETVVSSSATTRTGWETASTVKLDILAALLSKTGQSGQLTSSQTALAKKMISISDNASATSLWNQAGGSAGMNAFYQRLGMSATTAGAGGKWGLTKTTASDQLAVLRAVAYPNTTLSTAARATAKSLLDGVISSQRWGLTAGVPSGVAVEIKNGWLPYDGGWVINSLAHVHGNGRDYVMAAYTRDSASESTGIATVEGLSRIAWAAGTVRG